MLSTIHKSWNSFAGDEVDVIPIYSFLGAHFIVVFVLYTCLSTNFVLFVRIFFLSSDYPCTTLPRP